MIKLNIHEPPDTTTELEFREDETITVGRSGESSVVLKGNRVSREHCKIFFTGDHWKVVDLDSKNGIVVNGRKVNEEAIKDGDVVQISDFKIQVAVYGKSPEVTSVIGNGAQTVFVSRPGTAPGKDDADVEGGALKNKVLSILKVGDREGTKAATRPDTGIKKAGIKTGIIALGLAFLIIIIVLTLRKPEPATEQSTQEDVVVSEEEKKVETIQDLQTTRKVAKYIKRGKEMFDGGDFSKALTRFELVLDMAPTNEEAAKYARLCKEKIGRGASAQRVEQEEASAVQQRVDTLVGTARKFHEKGEYEKAKELLAEAKYLSPSDKSVESSLHDVDEQVKAQKARLEEEAKKKEEALAQVRRGYSKGQKYYDQRKYALALQEWEKVISTGLPCTETDEARKRVPELRSMLMEKVKDNYDKGIEYYDNKQYGKALAWLQKVVEVSPEFKDAKEKRDKMLEIQESKAKKLYQEGLVYEGIGQMDKAIGKWRAVLQTMPIESNEYHKKARSKLEN